jgi:phage shock protein PspC (stress-responsive transcriptional regulator)
MSATDNNLHDPDDDATIVRWIPVVVPLLALLPTLAAYFILWGVLVRR